ncbi:MAG: MBL fold metallo-hydrolase [Parcubacteria group bacterium]
MNISWLGHSCFKLEEKIGGNNVTVVTDPYDNETGLRFPKTRADILTVSHYHHDHGNAEAVIGAEDGKPPFLIDRPGEYETKGVFVNGIGSYHDNKEGAERGKSVMFLFTVEGVRVLHLGDLGTTLSDAQLEKIGEVDVLLIPVGGKYTINAKEAAEVVRQIEPCIVIPMHYKTPETGSDLDGVEKFAKEMGNGAEKTNKLKVVKKDLAMENTKLVIMERT